jgi:hypothetical protein
MERSLNLITIYGEIQDIFFSPLKQSKMAILCVMETLLVYWFVSSFAKCEKINYAQVCN